MTPPAKRVEVQFVIERACPHCVNDWKPLLAVAPIAVWVQYPAKPTPRSGICQDADTYFLLTPEGEATLEEAALGRMIGSYGFNLVCGHMGHVIE